MNRQDLQAISRTRVREAKVLLENGNYSGSYYLMGYAIECAIKAAIAKQVNRHDFPDKNLAIESWKHDLRNLLQTAGLWAKFQTDIRSNAALNDNWAVIKDWNETYRYNVQVSGAQAKDLYSACTARKNGMLSWLKNYW
jgi:AbiV family abortive infection protein